jgi:dUTP pyrophosphatase
LTLDRKQTTANSKPFLTINQSIITFAPMQKVTINIVNKSSNELPSYATAGSAGMDLRANLEEPIVLKPLERQLVPTGLFIELPDGYEAQVRPRSGLAIKQGITCLNTPGTIDSDYRGEIKVILINLSNEPQPIHHGDRIAQMVIAAAEQAILVLTEQLNDTVRGEGGFGHTGKN